MRPGTRLETTTPPKERRTEILSLPFPPNLEAQILDALAEAGLREAPLAVRSSALAEDGKEASFAGQFDSALGVRVGDDGAALWQAVRRVWASAFNLRAAAYRERAADASPVRMAVIVQEMVDAAASGVAFSIDPVTGDRGVAVVSAVYGLGQGLVDGAFDADTYRVSLGEPATVRSEMARKEEAVRPAPGGGTRVEAAPETLWEAPVLSDDEARRIAAAARRLEEAFGAPQDVEWSLVDQGEGERRLVILQSRPVTALRAMPEGCGERRVWDNSNIIESYCGVTTPLTFSFARGVYEEVYVQFCGLMGVSEALIEEHRPVFAGMIGLVHGRIYYNLLNWYRALALLPGYSVNRAFMERMMGVRQKLADPPAPPYVAGRREDLVRLLRMAGRLVREYRRLPRAITAFHARVERSLGSLEREDLSGWSLDELAALYRDRQRELLRQWRAPLVNDFFAMIAFGLLARLVERWLPGAPPTLMNDLLCGEGGIISTEPARRVEQMAQAVAGSPGLLAGFAAQPNDAALWRTLREAAEHVEFVRAVDAYLERFGDRCLNELKLETVTLRENPAFLLRMVRARLESGHDRPADRAREGVIRRDAEATVCAQLRDPRRSVFGVVLRHARRRIRDRENLRFERTRVFGLVRRIFLAIGGHLAAAGRLENPRDIFYLTTDEIFGWLNGTGATADLRGLAALRQAEYDEYRRGPAPPDRFETHGPPGGDTGLACHTGPTCPASLTATGTGTGEELVGTGCCPGVVRAPVRVVCDPASAVDLPGCILVAERTDPGWTLLFPLVKGLLVQRGSLLSHSAIVAREMSLPCIVGVAGLLETLRDADWVEMNGATGRIRRLSVGAAGSDRPVSVRVGVGVTE